MSERGGVSRGRALITLFFKGESLWVEPLYWIQVWLMVITAGCIFNTVPKDNKPAVAYATVIRLVEQYEEQLLDYGAVFDSIFGFWNTGMFPCTKNKIKSLESIEGPI